MMNRSTGAIAIALLYLVASSLIFLPDYNSPHVVKFLIITQFMFALSVLLYLTASKLDFANQHKRLFYLLLTIAILARIIISVGSGDKAYMSDDIYRYVWDGKVSAHGINPYLYSPRDTEVEFLVDSTIYPNINHANLPTIYPPMAQNAFLVSYMIGSDTIFGFKIIAALFELLTIFALYVWLKMLHISRAKLLLWLFSPLILIEFYMSSHLDIIGLPFLIGSLITMNKRQPQLTGLLLAISTLVKFYGLFLLPFFFFHFKRKNKLRFIIAFTSSVILLYLPYLISARTSVFGSLMKYLTNWQYSGSVFLLVKQFLDVDQARITVASAFVLWVLIQIIRKCSPYKKMFATLGGYLILTPAFFPWYFVWIFPFLLQYLSPAFLLLSGSILLSYHGHISMYENGYSETIVWLMILTYLPFFILLIIETIGKRRLKTTDA